MKNKSEIQPWKLAKVVWRHVPTMHAPISSSAAVFRGKETAGPKNTHIIEQKTNYPLRTVLENSSRYGWETNFLFVSMWGVEWRNACEMQLLRGSKVSGEHKMFLCKCYIVNLGPRGLFALMFKCLKPSLSFVASIFRLLKR